MIAGKGGETRTSVGETRSHQIQISTPACAAGERLVPQEHC